MIKNIAYTIYFFLLIALHSCTSDTQEKTEINEENQVNGSEIENEVTTEDTMADQDTIVQIAEVYDNEELKEAKEKIEKEYGIQWDFCSCVVKNDSINKAIEGDVSDSDIDFLLERLETVDEKCKGMLVLPNSTPEERYEHEKRVGKCLKANKK